MMIEIVIAEDQALLRGALSTLLALENDISIVGEAADGGEALELVRRHNPHVLVTDIEMPVLSGIDLAERVQRLELNVQILIVTTFARPGYLQRAMQAGVRGYVLKDAPSDELANAVRMISKGQSYIDSALVTDSWGFPDPLNDRERQILRLAENGCTNKEIAGELRLSPGTVRNYLADATRKLGANNRVEAFRVARENGWL